MDDGLDEIRRISIRMGAETDQLLAWLLEKAEDTQFSCPVLRSMLNTARRQIAGAEDLTDAFCAQVIRLGISTLTDAMLRRATDEAAQ